MLKVLNNYKGVIVFLLIVFVFALMYSNQIKKINNLSSNTNQVITYEK